MDAIRIARAQTGRDTIVKIFGSYHGHHDYVMVSIGVPYDEIGDRENYASLPYGAGHPAGGRRHDRRRAVQRRGRDGAADRAAVRGGPAAGLRDHGAGDDEPRGRAPRAGLPRGRARADASARRAAGLRRGQDGPLRRGRRRDRALRRHARHRSRSRRRSAAGCPPARSAAPRRRSRSVEKRRGLPGRHVQREPAGDGGRAREPAARCSRPRPTSTSRRSRTGCSRAART